MTTREVTRSYRPAGGYAGAVQTIITLLKKPENRCAAVTMLGKTVEMCYLQARSVQRMHPGFCVHMFALPVVQQLPSQVHAGMLKPPGAATGPHGGGIYTLALPAWAGR